jgi:hypothetical protein
MPPFRLALDAPGDAPASPIWLPGANAGRKTSTVRDWAPLRVENFEIILFARTNIVVIVARRQVAPSSATRPPGLPARGRDESGARE